MYKLLIVDDEAIERDGMANLIPWQAYGVELVGTAWNGMDGYEKIEALHPDIVLTDIKMPVMNGIELIRKTKYKFQDIEFLILSGYGEYEFTSQAMEEGVRHYILKPCDEAKIVEVLDKVKAEIDGRREQKKKEVEVRWLMPRVKEQIFRNLLLGRASLDEDYRRFLMELGEPGKKIRVLAMRGKESFDELEQFILGNVLGELLGRGKELLSAVIQNDVLFLIEGQELEGIIKAVECTWQELGRMRNTRPVAAVSDTGTIESIAELYNQTQELCQIGMVQPQGKVFHYRMSDAMESTAFHLVDYERISAAEDYVQILFETTLFFMKMDLLKYSYQEKEQGACWSLKVLYGKEVPRFLVTGSTEEEKTWGLFETVTEIIVNEKKINAKQGKEEQRVRDILLALFQHIGQPELSIQFLAKKVLFMNEDYVGRMFARNRRMKFSTFLLEQRIYLAQRMIQFDPEIKISRLADMVGYSLDGQYFSRAFRKVTGKTPTQYRKLAGGEEG